MRKKGYIHGEPGGFLFSAARSHSMSRSAWRQPCRATRWFCCLFGGNANNGANAGFGYLNANNRPANTDANIGARLYRKRYLSYVSREIHSIKRACNRASWRKRAIVGFSLVLLPTAERVSGRVSNYKRGPVVSIRHIQQGCASWLTIL